jgi:S1-C subfamily serine protease
MLLGLACVVHGAQAPDPAAQVQVPVAVPVPVPSITGTPEEVAPAVVEPDLAEQQLSQAARNRLDRARGSIVQIRGFLANSASSAFHGSGFSAGDDGLIVTNFHVVSEAVLHPGEYRLEYVTADDRTGVLRVYAVDVQNDLAVVGAPDLNLPPLRLRTDIPDRGERAWSIGYPLNLGLTITEGVANGIVANSFEQRIHYTGAINSGMSGGPALDVRGAVYGVNVSVIQSRQLVGFVVPAKHIPALLARASKPLQESYSTRQLREMITSQVLAHQTTIFDFGSRPPQAGTQKILGFTLPTQLVSSIECGTTGGAEIQRYITEEVIACAGRSRLLVQTGVEVGDVRYQHRVLRTPELHPLQFAWRVNRVAAAYRRAGSPRDVADYACKDSLTTLDGFDARLTLCVRQYRLFSGLYDIAASLVSIHEPRLALVSHLDLHGVGFEPGMVFVRRYLEAMRWTP